MNRLPIQYSLPQRYRQTDFQGIIDKVIEDSKIKVKDGLIQMKLIHREKEFERFGKKFKLNLMGMAGQIWIIINEL